uniref:RNA helicase n=1 Tax=Oryzias sinensis TaxID=183150 RepID=A0A8C7WM96_9TELE
MAQRKKKLTKKKRHHQANREPESESDGDFELAAEPGRKLLRFPSTADCTSDVEPDTRELVRAQNKKKKKSGGFQSMGLSYPVYKGVMKKGYKVPTPIQRKTIPVILDGKDVVAMARTGSGKTAAFLVPMFEKLKAPQASAGARALILSPTRELALQTMKFTKELGKFVPFFFCVVLYVSYCGFRLSLSHGLLPPLRLFEMGFAEQLQEIIQRLPDTRQTLLFSATLPKLLVEFARAGEINTTEVSFLYELSFFHLRVDDKPAMLLHLLKNVAKPQEQTVVFVATKHHVEYLRELLSSEGIECAYIYSALDQTARKINIGKFVHRKAMVLIVTDVAARGIDIPMLDIVINYNFPSKPKLFLHRVGRVGRAGRSGTTYSLICPDEMPFLYDLHLFLGRPVQFATLDHTQECDGVLGRVPQNILDDEGSNLITAHENSLDLQNLHRVSENAYKQYLKSRPNPSAESIRRVKNLDLSCMAVHPFLGCGLEKMELERLQIVDAIKVYKSKSTIFEINSNSKTTASEVMRAKRSKDTPLMDKFSKRKEDLAAENKPQLVVASANNGDSTQGADEEEEDLKRVFSEVLGGKRKGPQKHEEHLQNKRRKQTGKDEEYYIPYRPKDFNSEKGLSLGGEGSNFEHQASSAVLDLMGDDSNQLNQHKKIMKWDRKRKRFVTETRKEDHKKKIKTENNRVVVNKKNRKNFYEEWKKKYKVDDADSGSEGETGRGRGRRGPTSRRTSAGSGGRRVRSELKTSAQILKQRKIKDKQKFLQGGGMKKIRAKNKKWVGEVKKAGFGRGSQKKGKLKKRL